MDINNLKNPHFFVLGTNCIFTGSFWWGCMQKGPVDNVNCIRPDYIDALIDGTYMRKLVHFKRDELHYGEDPYDGHDGPCYHLYNETLGLMFEHCEWKPSFVKNQAIRYNNFKEFYKKALECDNYYFLLSTLRFSNLYNKEFLSWADTLRRYNLMDKTIVFGVEEYKDAFSNYIVLPYEEDNPEAWHKNDQFVLEFFKKYAIRH